MRRSLWRHVQTVIPALLHQSPSVEASALAQRVQAPHLNVTVALLSLALALLVVGCGSSASVASKPEIHVAAASDLRFALPEIADGFERETGAHVTIVFGSTGTLAQQIAQGAPVDAFFAADESFLDQLRGQQRVVPETQRVYAIGRLVVAVQKHGGVEVTTLQDLTAPTIRQIAIANPEHAPYGRAAKQALETAGLWSQVQPKLVYGESISQALQYLETGNVDAAILARSVVGDEDLRWTPIDESLHAPLRQGAAVVAGSRQRSLATQFLAYVSGPKGKVVFEKYGFAVPSE